MALQRQADADHTGEHRGVPGGHERDPSGADPAARGDHAGDPVAIALERR